MAEKKEITLYRCHAIDAAKDLWYGDDVVKQLKNAKTISEMELIMISARRKRFGD